MLSVTLQVFLLNGRGGHFPTAHGRFIDDTALFAAGGMPLLTLPASRG